MDKDLLKFLVLQSYTKGILDNFKVETIASKLNRRQLKEYIKELKKEESVRFINVYCASQLDKEQEEKIKKMFPNKKVFYNTDESFFAGIKIKDMDDVYEVDLKDFFEDFIEKIAQDL